MGKFGSGFAICHFCFSLGWFFWWLWFSPLGRPLLAFTLGFSWFITAFSAFRIHFWRFLFNFDATSSAFIAFGTQIGFLFWIASVDSRFTQFFRISRLKSFSLLCRFSGNRQTYLPFLQFLPYLQLRSHSCLLQFGLLLDDFSLLR